MLRRELGIEVALEAGAYGTFTVSVDGEEIIDGGPLAFMGVLPRLADVRDRVAQRLGRATPNA